MLVALNHHGLELNTEDLKHGGLLLHVTPGWTFSSPHRLFIEAHDIRVARYPISEVLDRLGAAPVVAKVLLSSIVWAVLGQKVRP